MGRANTAELPKRGVPVSDLEVLDALLDLIGEDDEAEREFLDWLTGDMDVRASVPATGHRAAWELRSRRGC